MKALTTEIKDIQQEFERDRGDLLETIREQEQKLILLQQILEKVQPTIRKDCNYRYSLCRARCVLARDTGDSSPLQQSPEDPGRGRLERRDPKVADT